MQTICKLQRHDAFGVFFISLLPKSIIFQLKMKPDKGLQERTDHQAEREGCGTTRGKGAAAGDS